LGYPKNKGFKVESSRKSRETKLARGRAGAKTRRVKFRDNVSGTDSTKGAGGNVQPRSFIRGQEKKQKHAHHHKKKKEKPKTLTDE